MRRKLYPIDILKRARKIAYAWEVIGTDILFGHFTNQGLQKEILQAEEIEARIRTAELQLAALRNERDAHYLCLWDQVKRLYEGARAIYGDDSVQYELVGRKRASQRKPRSRRIVLDG